LEHFVIVLGGGYIADCSAVIRPQRVPVMQLRPLVLVRVVRVDVLALDLGQILFGLTKFIDTVERVELGNRRSPVTERRYTLSNRYGETVVRMPVAYLNITNQ